MKKNIPFSPLDMTEAEIQEVADALRSGWITTGPKTKEFERLRNLNSYTYKQIVIVVMRKVIDSAQTSEMNRLIAWAKSNSINLDS